MSERKTIYMLFLLFVACVVARAAFGQTGEEYSQEVPDRFQWAMFGVPSQRFFGTPEVPNEGLPSYTLIVVEPGSRVTKNEFWKPNEFVRQGLDGSYLAAYRTVILYRFDPSQKVPDEPANEEENIRRWMVSQPIAIAIRTKPATGWFRENYFEESMGFIAAFYEAMGLELEDQTDPEVPKMKKKPAPPVVPVFPDSPATEVRFRTGPRRGPF